MNDFTPFAGNLQGPNGVPILGRGLQASTAVIAESVVRTQAIQMAVQLAVANPDQAKNLAQVIGNAAAIFDYVVEGKTLPAPFSPLNMKENGATKTSDQF